MENVFTFVEFGNSMHDLLSHAPVVEVDRDNAFIAIIDRTVRSAVRFAEIGNFHKAYQRVCTVTAMMELLFELIVETDNYDETRANEYRKKYFLYLRSLR